jgi:hypothetical protein
MVRHLLAVFLIALVVSPFTAPFSTCDLAVVNALHPDDAVSAAKTVQATSAIPSRVSNCVIVEQPEELSPRNPAVPTAGAHPLSPVLRL